MSDFHKTLKGKILILTKIESRNCQLEVVKNSIAFLNSVFKSKISFQAYPTKYKNFNPFSIKMKVFTSTNFNDKTIKITVINFLLEYGLF